ncbi:hypothetical protein CF326_g7526 [Tilletia indica]|nr:hypothetical protein CF326_g7526 [Tilletia indica]
MSSEQYARTFSSRTSYCRSVPGGRAKQTTLQADRRQHIFNELIHNKPHLVFASPEALISNPTVQEVIKNDAFRSRLQCIVVDEAHIVETWGLTPSARTGLPFRPLFSKVQTIRARLGSHLPLLALSATLPPTTTKAILPILEFGFKNTFAIDVGVNRPNIFYHVLPLQHTETTFRDILELFDCTSAERSNVPKTLLYVKTRATAYAVAELLDQHFAKGGLEGMVLPFTSLTTASSKDSILGVLFRPGGKLRVLVSTEAGGLGIDLRDIDRVVQHLLPNTTLEIAQHVGRAVRDKSLVGQALILAPSRICLRPGHNSASQSTIKLRQGLDTGIRAITGGQQCIRQALVRSSRLDVSQLPAQFPSFQKVEGGLNDIVFGSTVAEDNAPQHQHQLATIQQQQPTYVKLGYRLLIRASFQYSKD